MTGNSGLTNGRSYAPRQNASTFPEIVISPAEAFGSKSGTRLPNGCCGSTGFGLERRTSSEIRRRLLSITRDVGVGRFTHT